MAAELAIIAKLQDEASSGIRALRGEIEGVGESGGIAAKGFQSLQTVGAVALTALAGAVTLAAGATALKRPEKVFWGGYSGYWADPDGHVWEVAMNPYWPLGADGSLRLPG